MPWWCGRGGRGTAWHAGWSRAGGTPRRPAPWPAWPGFTAAGPGRCRRWRLDQVRNPSGRLPGRLDQPASGPYVLAGQRGRAGHEGPGTFDRGGDAPARDEVAGRPFARLVDAVRPRAPAHHPYGQALLQQPAHHPAAQSAGSAGHQDRALLGCHDATSTSSSSPGTQGTPLQGDRALAGAGGPARCCGQHRDPRDAALRGESPRSGGRRTGGDRRRPNCDTVRHRRKAVRLPPGCPLPEARRQRSFRRHRPPAAALTVPVPGPVRSARRTGLTIPPVGSVACQEAAAPCTSPHSPDDAGCRV